MTLNLFSNSLWLVFMFILTQTMAFMATDQAADPTGIPTGWPQIYHLGIIGIRQESMEYLLRYISLELKRWAVRPASGHLEGLLWHLGVKFRMDKGYRF